MTTTVVGPEYPGNTTGRFCVVRWIDILAFDMLSPFPVPLTQWDQADDALRDNIKRLAALDPLDWAIHMEWTLRLLPVEIAQMLTSNMRVAIVGTSSNARKDGDA